MLTYQDFKNAEDVPLFIDTAIVQHQLSDDYKIAADAELYAKKRNVTIEKYQKLLYTVTGKVVPNNYEANHKCKSNFFDRFIRQETQYLLGNGVTFNDDKTKASLENNKYKIDTQLQKLAKQALIAGISFGFWNFDHLEVFPLTQFVPLWDEETSALRAGIRFWRISKDKPLRITVYEEDGFVNYVKSGEQVQAIDEEKSSYIKEYTSSKVDGETVKDFSNYKSFPIIPLYGNPAKQSELIGLRENIDCYDLIKSGFANDLDDASMIYWVLQDADAMDEIDLAEFIERLKSVKAVTLPDGVQAESHSIDVPYQSRETYLARLENDLYRDACAVNTHSIFSGNVTATAIRSAYQDLDDKVDEFEYCIVEFIDNLFALIDIDDSPTFKRNRMVNQAEETQMILSAAQYLDDETILKKLPFLSPDEIESIQEKRLLEEATRYEDEEE